LTDTTPERPEADPGIGAGLRIRRAVRAVIVADDDSDHPVRSVLLVRFEFPTGTVWALPGGGLDPGEDHLTALRRELIEEVGLHDPEIGAHIWTRQHIIPFIDGMWDGQQDRYHLVPVAEAFEPTPALSWEQLRDERLHEIRWWTPAEIDAATEQGTRFAPARLGELLTLLRTDGPPSVPIDTGV